MEQLTVLFFLLLVIVSTNGIEFRPKKQPAIHSLSRKLHVSHRFSGGAAAGGWARKDELLSWAKKDAVRIETMMNRKVARTGGDQAAAPSSNRALFKRLEATVRSGVAVGRSGDFLVDIYVGTPPRPYQMVLDTGSDLNWLKCAPCRTCFDKHTPLFVPAASSSYRNVTCRETRCRLSHICPTEAPGAFHRPRHDPCPYYYGYGDGSNTTGDLALETFTVNLTAPGKSHRIDDVVFGCSHQISDGSFHRAAGVLGLGRGPLSFASQLHLAYFSYCFVDNASNVTSKLVFGEDAALLKDLHLNYTAFVPLTGTSPQATYYHVKIKGVLVGRELLNIPSHTWDVANNNGSGGTIVDSGTTLGYFAEPAYQVIRQAFVDRMGKSYPLIPDFPVFDPCYNVSGVERPEVPELSLLFADGAVWNFSAENYFILFEPDDIMCLALGVLESPFSSMSVIGNIQQQNFHIMYDLQNNRLGFAPRRCAEVH